MLKIRLIAGILTVFFLGTLHAQEQEPQQTSEKSVYLKGNALLIPVGVINVGLEHQLNKKFSTGRCFNFSVEIFCRT
jgi:hypothetical protein